MNRTFSRIVAVMVLALVSGRVSLGEENVSKTVTISFNDGANCAAAIVQAVVQCKRDKGASCRTASALAGVSCAGVGQALIQKIRNIWNQAGKTYEKAAQETRQACPACVVSMYGGN